MPVEPPKAMEAYRASVTGLPDVQREDYYLFTAGGNAVPASSDQVNAGGRQGPYMLLLLVVGLFLWMGM